MDAITFFTKLKEQEQVLNRDHKIILLLLWEQSIKPTDKNTLTPSELGGVGLYGKRTIQNTLKDLHSYGLVDKVKGNYQITPKFQYQLGKISYKKMKQDEDITDITGYTQGIIEKYIGDLIITNTQKQKLLNDLKVSSNQHKTILHHFKIWFEDVEGHKHFNAFREYENDKVS